MREPSDTLLGTAQIFTRGGMSGDEVAMTMGVVVAFRGMVLARTEGWR